MSRAPSDRAAVFAALGDPVRLGLVTRLGDEGPLSITELTAPTGVTRQAVTRHLQVLADAGLVRHERAGREHRWALEAARLVEARRHLEAISAQWDATIERLRAFVE